MPRRRSVIEAEKNSVASMLAKLPDGAVIDRMSLSGRLEELDRELAGLPADSLQPDSAHLVFDGSPVIGSRAAFADFASDALKIFTETVTRMAASFDQGPLAAMGPVPKREEHRLLVTGIVRGSFGFQLEPQPPTGQQTQKELPIAEALNATLEFFESTAESDEKLSDALEKMDDRALTQMRAFLSKLDSSGAICGFAIGKRTFRFPNSDAVRKTLDRIGGDNVEETLMDREIVPRGVLPHHRRMEFSWAGEDDILYARIASEVENPSALNKFLGKQLQAKFKQRIVGKASPRYTLMEIAL